MHASINSRLGKQNIREGKVKDVASAVYQLSQYANIVYRGPSSLSSQLYTSISYSNSRLKGLISSVKVSSYKVEQRGYKMCNVLDNMQGVQLSIVVKYYYSIYYCLQYIQVVKALPSLVFQVASFTDVGYYLRVG